MPSASTIAVRGRQYDPSHRQVATAYRPKGDSILYAISPNITRSYSILSDESPLQDLSVVANDHCPSHYQSSQSPSLSYVASLGPPRSRVLLAARAATPAAALRPEEFSHPPTLFLLAVGIPDVLFVIGV